MNDQPKKYPYSVLLCEDDESARIVAERILRRHFETVYVASNGIEGFNMFNWHKIDVLVTDLTMPGITGLQLIRDIHARNKFLPVVVISAHEESQILLEAIEAGVNQYVLKPLTASKLIGAVHKVLGLMHED